MAKIIKSEILIKVVRHCVKTVEKKGLSIVFTFACLFVVFTVSCKYCGFFFLVCDSRCPNKPLPPVVFSSTFLMFK